MRFIALVLFVAHLGATAGPALETLTGTEAGPHCSLVRGHTDGASAVKAQKECEACKMVGCTHAMVCSGVTPALAVVGVLVMVSSFAETSLLEQGSPEANFESNPIPPPPRA